MRCTLCHGSGTYLRARLKNAPRIKCPRCDGKGEESSHIRDRYAPRDPREGAHYQPRDLSHQPPTGGLDGFDDPEVL